MQSIITRYYGATNTKPSCIRAWTSGNPKQKRRYSLQHELTTEANHMEAARQLATLLRWKGRWIEGGLDNSSNVYVCAESLVGTISSFEVTV